MNDEARLPVRAEDYDGAGRPAEVSRNVIPFESDRMPLKYAVAAPEFTIPDRLLHTILTLERKAA